MEQQTHSDNKEDDGDRRHISEDVVVGLTQKDLDAQDHLVEARGANCNDKVILRGEAHLVKGSQSLFYLIIEVLLVTFPKNLPLFELKSQEVSVIM